MRGSRQQLLAITPSVVMPPLECPKVPMLPVSGCIAVTLIPRFHRAGVTTAYAYLGARFGRPTHIASALVFLVLRGLSVGFVIYAPSLVLSLVFGWPLDWTIVGLGVVATAYTSIGYRAPAEGAARSDRPERLPVMPSV